MQRDNWTSSNHETERQDTPSAPNKNVVPTIICFHGSGDNALPDWKEFVSLAQPDHRVVLLDRGSGKMSLEDANSALLEHLRERHLDPPYVLVAHSYGGAFAKMFFYKNPNAVAGMLLVETGQEGGLSDNVEKSLLNRCLMNEKPLSVIRGNSLVTSWRALEAAEPAADSESGKAALRAQRQFLEACDAEDERLKKVQLGLSRNTRYVHLPDCGHGVIRDRPDVVFKELQWIMANLRPVQASTNLWDKFTRWWLRLRS